jgi:arginine exporter protein ArgO
MPPGFQFPADFTGLTVKTMWSIWSAGLMTGLALILAIGAQNAFVLRQGIRREHVGVVVVLCIASDAILILGGTFGIGALVLRFPAALIVLKWGGAAYLAWWAARSFAAALKPSSLTVEATGSRGSAVSTTLAVTYLNPHVYLDTLVVLGGPRCPVGLRSRGGGRKRPVVPRPGVWGPGTVRGAQQPAHLAGSGPGYRHGDARPCHQADAQLIPAAGNRL